MVANKANPETQEQIISYQKLRAFIGFTGIFLPIAVVVGCYILSGSEHCLQPSISHYYYSKVHIVFIACLCVLGGFLITYKGRPNNPWESRLSNFAGYCALGIAAFPTGVKGFLLPVGVKTPYLSLSPEVTEGFGNLHFVFAGLLFASFAIFCFVFFQHPDRPYDTEKEQKKFRRRKRIYKACGWAIIISIVMIGVFHFIIKREDGIFCYTTFIFETTSLWAFGIAWLVKGSAILTTVPFIKEMIKSFR